MLSMAEQKTSLLNRLEAELPDGLLVDAAWLEERGIASNLRAYYVKSGWLEQPARGVYRRPRGRLNWQQVVISLQTLLLRSPFFVGGRTSLELQGFSHYLSQGIGTVHLYGPDKPPGWLQKLDLPQGFVHHNSSVLFRNDPVALGLHGIASGHWDWWLTVSRPERAYLEMLDELPGRESFHQADMIMQGAASFSPRRLQKLLLDCKSVKVKRLFFFFADRHRHSWLKHLEKDQIDLGEGKRVLVPGGRLDPVYRITVPRDLDAVS